MTIVEMTNLRRRQQALSEEIDQAIALVHKSGQYVGGKSLVDFENSFAEITGHTRGIGVGNGLDAIEIGLRSLGVAPGDHVLVPAYTFIATWIGVQRAGAVPIPVEVDPQTATMDPAACEAAWSPKVTAMVPVHLYGNYANMASLMSFAARYDIRVLDDCAQAHGHPRLVNDFTRRADASAYSFYPTKNLGALGDGGGLVTSYEDVAQAARQLRSYGSGEDKYDYVRMGMNSRLDPLQAAVLSVFLVHLHTWNSRRINIANRYIKALGEHSSCTIGQEENSDLPFSVRHHFVVLANQRTALQGRLLELGVSSDSHYPYVAAEVWGRLQNNDSGAATTGSFTASRILADKATSLPVHPWLTDVEVDQVCEALAIAAKEGYLHC